MNTAIQLDYTVTSERPFDTVVSDVERLTAENGFRVLHTHDVAATLNEKGFERGPLKIVEVCNAKYAHAVLAQDPKISLMLPCPISIWTEGGKTVVSTLRPSLISQMYPGADVADVANQVESVLIAIVDGSV